MKNIKLITLICCIVCINVGLALALFIGKYADRSSDAYIYGIPEGARTSYKAIPMFDCSWCHRTNRLNRHHIMQQKYYPELRDEPTNIIVLCRDCHFVLGHRCNWHTYNPDVMTICNTYTNICSERIDR